MASKCASKTLFVGNLHSTLDENDLLDIFKPYGRIIECCKRWSHYGFIQFATDDEANIAFNNLNGSRVRGRPMRIEFQRKKIRNLEALLEAEAESRLHQQLNSHVNFLTKLNENNQSLFNHINLNNIENLEPSFLRQFGQNCENSNLFANTLFSTSNSSISRSNEYNIEEEFFSLFYKSNENTDEKQTMLRSIDTNSINKSTKNEKLNYLNTNDENNLFKFENSDNDFDLNDLKKDHQLTITISACSSPISSSNTHDSPTNSTSPSSCKSKSKSSIMLFRSVNKSNTIYVEPTDVLEPLSDGNFNEYKLFPSSSNNANSQSSKTSQCNLPISIEPQIFDIFSYSSSISSSSSSCCSNSPNNSLTNSPNSSAPLNLIKFFMN